MKTKNKQKWLRKATLWIAFLIIGQTAWATDWISKTSGTTKTLRSVTFSNDTTAYSAGLGGTILKSGDRGKTWSALTSGITTDLYSVDFTTDSVGYAVGASGVILKTVDTGNSWSKLTSGITGTLRKISFVDKNTGYAVGLSGVILKTTDAGITWERKSSSLTSAFYSVYFKDALHGYVMGESGIIIKTDDGGENWSSMNLGQTSSATFFSMFFTNDQTGYLTGWASGMFKTIDGGNTWKQVISSNYSKLYLNSICFTDESTGYVVGTSKVMVTTDAGETWNDMTFPSTATYIRQVDFTGKNKGVAVGDNGLIIKLSSVYSLTHAISISSVGQAVSYNLETESETTTWNATSSDAWLIPDLSAGTGSGTFTAKADTSKIIGSRTGTITITDVSNNETAIITVAQAGISLSTTSIKVPVIASDTTISITANGYWKTTTSDAWLSTTPSTGTGSGTFVIHIAANPNNVERTGVVTLSDTISSTTLAITITQKSTAYFTAPDTIKVPIDAGSVPLNIQSNVEWSVLSRDSWLVSASTTGSNSTKLSLTNLNNSSSDRTTMLIFTVTTKNSGLTKDTVFVIQDGIQSPFSKCISGTTNALYGSCYTNDSTAFAVGDAGTIVKSTNAGNIWKTITSGTTNNLRSVTFVTDSLGFAAGASGVVLKTTDAGSTWNSITTTTTQTLYGISFLDKQIGVACGGTAYSSSVIVRTTDGGATWSTITVPTAGVAAGLNAIALSKDSVFYTCGYSGVVLKSTDLGMTWSTVNYSSALPFMSLRVIDKNTVYLGSTKLIKTIDGGTTWTAYTLPITDYAYGITSSNDSTLYTCGAYVTKTVNYGVNWSRIQTNSNLFYSLSFRSSSNGIMVGNGIYKFASFSLSSTNLTTSALAKDTTVSIIPLGSAVDWTATADSSWISVNKLDNQTLKISVASNPGIDLRVGTITVTAKDGTNHTYTIAQNGISLSVSATTLTLGSAENSNTAFAIAATTDWTVNSSDTWLTSNVTSGSDNATVTLTAKENASLSSRDATITVSNSLLGDKIITVTQTGASPKLALASDSIGFTNTPTKADTIAVTSNTTWTASTTASWLTVSQSVTSGDGNLLITASTNTSVAARVDTVYVAASGLSTLKIVVTQKGATPVVSLTSKDASYTYPATTITVPVTANTTFGATTAASWMLISNITATSFDLSLSENTSYANRWDSISVSVAGGNTARIAIIQGAAPGSYASISCTRDNTIIESSTGTLGNSLGAIYVGRTNQGTGQSIRRGLIYFDIATNVPANAVIDSVRLSMYQIGSVKDGSINLHKVLTNWTEGTSFFDGGRGATATTGDVTWLSSSYSGTSWTTAGGDFDATVSGNKKSLVEIESGRSMSTFTTSGMATDVQYWLANSSSNYGWLIQGDETVAGNAEAFRSKDGSDRSYNSPLLKVYYSTSPATGTSTLALSGFSIYPNPASTYTIVTLSEKSNEPIYIYNLCGKLMKTTSSNNYTQQYINVSDMDAGVYLLRIGNVTQKLIIK